MLIISNHNYTLASDVDFASVSDGKEFASIGGPGFYPWVGKIPWRRKWQLILVFLSGEFYGQRSLVGYSSWDSKESDTIE